MTLYVDVETTGLDARNANLRVVSIDGHAYDWWGLFDPDHPQYIKDILFSRQDEMVVAHNLQFDLDFLEEHVGWKPKGPIFDTMVAWQLLQCGRREPDGSPLSARLENVARIVLNVELDKTWQKGPWDGLLYEDQLQYAAEDTSVLKELHVKLQDALVKARLDKMMTLEMHLLPILVEAKRKGILLDVAAAENLLKTTNVEVQEITDQLPGNLNPRAPQQVSKFFNLPDSKEDTLREYKWHLQNTDPNGHRLKHLVKVMEARKLLKRASSVKKQLLGRVAKDGRIHTSFKQAFTETGRMSSSEPNLQNQDRSDAVRGLFIPSPGHKFVIADYSGVEMRIAALVSGDRNMRRVFNTPGGDIHAETQRAVFGDPDQMDKETKKHTRVLSKNVGFGSLFGGGHNTVLRFAARSDIFLTEKEAKQFQKSFFQRYPQLKAWHEKAGDTRPKYVYSILGRRRYIEPGEAYCTRINNRIQATAADGMKLALVMLDRKYGILPLVNVHDEIIVEVPENQAEEVCDIVEKVMVDAMYRATKQDPDNPIVPIAVEAGVADSWAEK